MGLTNSEEAAIGAVLPKDNGLGGADNIVDMPNPSDEQVTFPVPIPNEARASDFNVPAEPQPQATAPVSSSSNVEAPVGLIPTVAITPDGVAQAPGVTPGIPEGIPAATAPQGNVPDNAPIGLERFKDFLPQPAVVPAVQNGTAPGATEVISSSTESTPLAVATPMTPEAPAATAPATVIPVTAEAGNQPVDPNAAIKADVDHIISMGGVSTTEANAGIPPLTSSEQPVVPDSVPPVPSQSEMPASVTPEVVPTIAEVPTSIVSDATAVTVPETPQIDNLTPVIPTPEATTDIPTSEVHEETKEPELTDEEVTARLEDLKKELATNLETKKANLAQLQTEIAELEEALSSADDPKLIPMAKFILREGMHTNEKMAA